MQFGVVMLELPADLRRRTWRETRDRRYDQARAEGGVMFESGWVLNAEEWAAYLADCRYEGVLRSGALIVVGSLLRVWGWGK